MLARDTARRLAGNTPQPLHFSTGPGCRTASPCRPHAGPDLSGTPTRSRTSARRTRGNKPRPRLIIPPLQPTHATRLSLSTTLQHCATSWRGYKLRPGQVDRPAPTYVGWTRGLKAPTRARARSETTRAKAELLRWCVRRRDARTALRSSRPTCTRPSTPESLPTCTREAKISRIYWNCTKTVRMLRGGWMPLT